MTRTPDLATVIKAAIERRLEDVFVCLPGRIVLYDPATQMAQVQPLIKYPAPGQGTYLLPIIINVPVLFPRSSICYFSFPLLPGDLVTLIFADKSLDKFLQLGMEVDPEDNRIHYLNDAYAFPGGYPFTLPIPDINVGKMRMGLMSGAAIANVLIDPLTGDVDIQTTGNVNLGIVVDPTNLAIRDITTFIDVIVDAAQAWAVQAAADHAPDNPTVEKVKVDLITTLSTSVWIG